MSRVFIGLSLILSLQAHAQLDSSSAVLLRGKAAPSKDKLDSSRYKIRAPESRDEMDEKPGALIPTPVPNKPVPAKSTTTLQVEPTPPPVKEVVPAPVVEEPLPAPVPIANPTPAPEPAKEPEPPPVAAQVRNLILGGSEEEIAEVRQQIHPQDPRANVVEIQLAPAYFYQDSDSGYSFRDFTSAGPGFGLGANLWLTPFFSLQSRYFSSVSAGVRSGGVNTVPMDVQTFEAGVRFRKHFGYSRKAAHMTWGLDYHDASNKISREANTVIGRKSSGVSVSLGAVIPSSATYAHTLNVDVRPRLKHSEQATGVETRSGTKAETNAIQLSVGGEWRLDRRNQIFWRGQYGVERSLFKGSATLPDPSTGATPDGVSVTDSLFMFYFGFKWGS